MTIEEQLQLYIELAVKKEMEPVLEQLKIINDKLDGKVDKPFSIKDLMRYLGVSENTARRYYTEEGLGKKSPGGIYFPRKEIDNFFAKKK